MSKAPQESLWPYAWRLAVATLLYLAAILVHVPYLNGNPEWLRPYRPWSEWLRPGAEWCVARAIALTVTILVAIGYVAWRGGRHPRAAGGFLACLMALAILLQVAVVMMNIEGWYLLVQRVHNPTATGYFLDACKVQGVGEFLRTYTDHMSQFTMRPSTHPPGSTLFFWAALRLTQSWPFSYERYGQYVRLFPRLDIAWISPRLFARCFYDTLALLAACAATLPVVYVLGRMLHDHRTALRAAVLYAVTPVFSVRVPFLDHFYPAITVLGFCAFYHALRRNDCRWAAGSGAVLALGVFMSFGLLAMVVFCTAFAICEGRTLGARRLARLEGAFFCGLVIPFVLLRGLCGFDIVEAFQRAMANHAKIIGHRTYWLWAAYGPYEFFSWLGVPVAALFFRRLFRARHPDALLTACVATLLFVDFSGKSLGEVERIWLFLAPYVVLLASAELSTEDRGKGFWGVFALQSLSVIVFGAAFEGSGTA